MPLSARVSLPPVPNSPPTHVASALPARMTAVVVAGLLVLGPTLFGSVAKCKGAVQQDIIQKVSSSSAEAGSSMSLWASDRSEEAPLSSLQCIVVLPERLSAADALVPSSRRLTEELEQLTHELQARPLLVVLSSPLLRPSPENQEERGVRSFFSSAQASLGTLSSVVLLL